jgi:hypothetical protein
LKEHVTTKKKKVIKTGTKKDRVIIEGRIFEGYHWS